MADEVLDNHGNERRPTSPRSISPRPLSDEDIDEIARKLLEGNFYLSALEFHAELVEVGRELARFKDFFSNPGNFEIQMKLDPFMSVSKYIC